LYLSKVENFVLIIKSVRTFLTFCDLLTKICNKQSITFSEIYSKSETLKKDSYTTHTSTAFWSQLAFSRERIVLTKNKFQKKKLWVGPVKTQASNSGSLFTEPRPCVLYCVFQVALWIYFSQFGDKLVSYHKSTVRKFPSALFAIISY